MNKRKFLKATTALAVGTAGSTAVAGMPTGELISDKEDLRVRISADENDIGYVMASYNLGFEGVYMDGVKSSVGWLTVDEIEGHAIKWEYGFIMVRGDFEIRGLADEKRRAIIDEQKHRVKSGPFSDEMILELIQDKVNNGTISVTDSKIVINSV